MNDAVRSATEIIRNSEDMVVVTGAGISTESGI